MEILSERIFWIYFIIALFFIIIGITSILSYSDNILITVLWMFSNIFLFIIIYHIMITWCPNGMCRKNDSLWIFINVLFGVILLFSVLWCGYFANKDSKVFVTIMSVIILLCGILLTNMCHKNYTINNTCPLSTLLCVGFIIIWLYFIGIICIDG
jgi:hypothetical protein